MTLPPRPRARDDDAWIREVAARDGYEPAPCDCGFWEPTGLVLCRPSDRPRWCYPDAQERLAKHYAQERAAAARERRRFPGSPAMRLASKPGQCRWCGEAITESKRRTWHPACLWEFYCHTRGPEQKMHLLDTRGPWCAACGERHGGWMQASGLRDPNELRQKDAYYARVYPAGVFVAPFQMVRLTGGSLEVDHRVPLGLVVLTMAEGSRWRFWGPSNLQLLCPPCHKAKTVLDVRAIRAEQARQRA